MASLRPLALLIIALAPLALHAQPAEHVGTDPVDVKALAWDTTNNALYAGTATGKLARSSDNGRSWNVLDLPHEAGEGLDAVAARGTKLLVATSGFEDYSLRLSEDGGKNWEALSVLGINRYGVRGMGVGYGFLWIIDKSKKGLVSRDNGATWEPLIPDAPDLRVNALAVSGMELVAATESGLSRSTDGGATWREGVGGITATVSEVALSERGLVAAVQAEEGYRTVLHLYHLPDRTGGAAERLPFPDIENVNRTYTHSLLLDGDAILVGVFRNYHHLIGETRLMRTTDKGAHWSVLPGVDSLGLVVGVSGGGNLLVADGVRLLLSRDGGGAFEPTGTEVAGMRVGDIEGNGAVVAGGPYLYRTTGKELTRVEYAPWTAPPYRLLAARSETILVSTGSPMESYGPSIVMRSTDGGRRWNEVEKGLQVRSTFYFDNRLVTASIARMTDDGKRFVAFAMTPGLDGVYLSTDSGASWRGIDMKGWKRISEEITAFNDIAISGNDVIIATDIGLVRGSIAKGGWKYVKSWPKERGAQQIATDGAMVYVAAGSEVYISPDGGTTWRVKEELSGGTISSLTAHDRYAAAIVEGTVVVSSDRSDLWNHITLPEDVSPRSIHITPGTLWIGTEQHGLWRSPLR